MKNDVQKNDYGVAIYVRYNNRNLDELKKKEEILMSFCKQNNYNVVKKYFDGSGDCDQYFSNTMRNLLRNVDKEKIYSFITCDVFELCDDINKIIALYTVLDDEDIFFETLNQGVIGEDFLLSGSYDCNVLNNKNLEKPRISYIAGKVVDTYEGIF